MITSINTPYIPNLQFRQPAKTAAVKKIDSNAQSPLASQIFAPLYEIYFKETEAYLPLKYMEKYVNPETIRHAMQVNPEISNILLQHGITPKISEVNIGKSTKQHLLTTYLYAKMIARKINLDGKSTTKLCQAALLHDIGKALIPEEIMQKPTKLTQEERKIVNLHAKLSYEILKTTDVSPDVLELVKIHHVAASMKFSNKIALILSVADVYSALREKRPYKTEMTHKEAIKIMQTINSLSSNYVNILDQALK